MIRKVKKFFGEVRAELSKVSWPWEPREKGIKKYRELVDSTGVVLIAMLFLGAFVALSDFFLVNAVSAFTRTGIEERVRRPAALSAAEPAPAQPAPDATPAVPAPPAAAPAEPSQNPAQPAGEPASPSPEASPAPASAESSQPAQP